MDNTWKTVDEFNYETEAQPLIDVLNQKNIPYQMKYIEKTFNPSFMHNQLLEKIVINVPEQYYPLAHELWQKALAESEWYDIYPHYLDAFSEDELQEVVNNPEAWNSFDVNYAKKLLEKMKLKK